MKKRRIRYSASAIFFMVGILISCITLFDLMGIYSDLQNQEEDADQSVYPIEAVMKVDLGKMQDIGTYNLDVILPRERLEEMPINIQLTDIMVPYSEDGTVGTLQTIYYQGILSRFQVESGKLPGEESGISGIAVGRKEKDLIHTEADGSQYIYINRYEKMNVTGILGSASSDYQDRFLVADYDALSESLKRMIMEKTRVLELHIQMEEGGDIDSNAQELATIIRKYVPDAEITASVVPKNGKGFIHIYDSHVYFAVWVYIFCIGIFLVVSRFWIAQREKEMAVRKAFGMSGWQLACLLMRESGSMILGTLVLYAVLHMAVQTILPAWIPTIRINAENLTALLAFFILTIISCVGIPIWRCRQIQPSVLLKEYED